MATLGFSVFVSTTPGKYKQAAMAEALRAVELDKASADAHLALALRALRPNADIHGLAFASYTRAKTGDTAQALAALEHGLDPSTVTAPRGGRS